MAATSNCFLSTIKSYDAFLGHGGFGIVLRGTDTSQKTTAIKFLFPPKDDSKERKRIVTECNITKALERHENIVNIINFEEKQFTPKELQELLNLLPQDDDQLLSKGDAYLRTSKRHGTLDSVCIQTELCGENLKNWLQNDRERNDIYFQLDIIDNLLSGLCYLHSNKILHRDLKPGNIMFSGEKYQLPVKIGDFGLCRKIHSPETQTDPLTIRVGSPNYMAPEVRAGSDYSYQADLYSLGLIIWEIVQIIDSKNIMSTFEALTIDKDEDVVHEHASFIGVKQLIIDLTKRVVKERIQNIAEVIEISKVWRHFLVDKKEMNPTNGQELELCLKYAPVGCVINLIEGEYEGHFCIKQNNVKISGISSKTILKCRKNSNNTSSGLVIDGDGCTIKNVDIVTEHKSKINGIRLNGHKNTIQNVNFTNCDNGVYVHSNDNQMENLTMSNSEIGMYINGSNNVITQIKTENVDEGLFIVASNNTVSNWKSENVKKFGICVSGSDNKLSNISLTKDSESVNCVGMLINSDAEDNVVDNLSCGGYNRDSHDWGVRIAGHNSTLKDSKCGPVWVGGGNDITLTNVDGGEFIEFNDKITGLTLINCKGTKLKLNSNIESLKIEGCSFGSFE